MPEVDILAGPRARSWLVGGESGNGKTHFALNVGASVVDRLTAQGVPKEQWAAKCSVGFIACEDGAAPLIRRTVDAAFPPELRPAMKYMQCNGWNDVKTDTPKVIQWLTERMAAGVPLENTWLIVDNVHNLWTWLQDQFSNDIYGMSLKDLAKAKRQQAQRENKGNLPTFNRMVDYAIMNPEYNEWYSLFHPVGTFPKLNYVLTCPVWITREKENPSDRQSPVVITDVDPKCQPDTIFRCDEFMWMQKKDGAPGVPPKYFLSLRKSRCGKTFNGLPDPSVTKMLNFYQKHES